jgi:hypothetical protein
MSRGLNAGPVATPRGASVYRTRCPATDAWRLPAVSTSDDRSRVWTFRGADRSAVVGTVLVSVPLPWVSARELTVGYRQTLQPRRGAVSARPHWPEGRSPWDIQNMILRLAGGGHGTPDGYRCERALKPRQVWAIRSWLDHKRRLRHWALFDLAIDSKLRGRDMVRVRIGDIVSGGRTRTRATCAARADRGGANEHPRLA